MRDNQSLNLFFELLKLSSGGLGNELNNDYNEDDWTGAFQLAREQAIAGVLFNGLERLPKEQYPPRMVILQWLSTTEEIKRYTEKLSKAGNEALDFFKSKGFPAMILKGSAVGRYYPHPEGRSSGDIDIWLNGKRNEIYRFARDFDPNGMLYGVNYHHIHFHLFEDIPLEAHIWPSYLSSPLRNHYLHLFCDKYRPTSDTITPSLAFDRVFILLHCYRHMCGDGVGLRQIMDYFFVLKQGFNESERQSAVYWIRKLGMLNFCKGIIWILAEFFALDPQYWITEPDEKEGWFIMNEVMLTGNMGHSDLRNWGSKKTPLSRFFLNLRRDLYLARHYPHETLWQPFFSVWLYAWRLSKGLLRDRQ